MVAVAVFFLVQLILILFLSGNLAVTSAKAPTAAFFRLGDSRPPELAALEDPTLFVLPHHQSFSGKAWMEFPQPTFRYRNWSEQEPLRWLTTPNQLGLAFAQFMERNPATPLRSADFVEPSVTAPQIQPTPEIAMPSAVRIAGELAARRLIFCPPLRSWPAAELLTNNVSFLTNSVVQLLVDPSGEAFSAALLGQGSGYTEANKEALRIAKSMRFESIEPVGPDRVKTAEPKLMLGTLTFEWQTLPATNGPGIVP
jgi:hypothetical protein